MMTKEQYSENAARKVAAAVFAALRDYDATLGFGEGTPVFRLGKIGLEVLEADGENIEMEISKGFLRFNLPLPAKVEFGQGYIRVGEGVLPVDSRERAVADLIHLKGLLPGAVREYRAAMDLWPVEHGRQATIVQIAQTTVQGAAESLLDDAGLEGGCYVHGDRVIVKIKLISGRFRYFRIPVPDYEAELGKFESWIARYREMIGR